ncbi:MAG: hypothetical protein WCK10_04015 [Candidatus Staskawiczbacteria bacterium]
MNISFSKQKWVLLFLLSYFPNMCLGQEGGKISAGREKTRLAAQIIVDKLKEGFKSISVSEEELSDRMRKNPASANYQNGQFSDAKKSWEILRGEQVKNLQAKYNLEVEALLNNLDSRKPDSISSWFTKEDRQIFLKSPTDEINQSLNNNFGEEYNSTDINAFTKARQKVILEERNKLSLDVYPTEDEVENFAPGILEAILHERLTKKLEARYFLENLEYLKNDIAKAVVDDAKSQLEGQGKIANEPYLGQKIFPKEIEAEIRGKVEKYQKSITSAKEKSGEKICCKTYKTFPSVEKEIPKLGKSWAIQAFCSIVSTWEKIPITVKRLKASMQKNIEKHIDTATSLNLLNEEYFGPVRKVTINWFIDKVEEENKKEFGKFLKEILDDNR